MISSYPSLYALGHRATKQIFDNDVIVQEKIDGSQFSFGVDRLKNLHIRSKGCTIYPESADKLFRNAVQQVILVKDKLLPGHIYRAEAITSPKHNHLNYSRAAIGYIVLFDIEQTLDVPDTLEGSATFLAPEQVTEQANLLGIEPIRNLHKGKLSSVDEVLHFMELESQLGGPKLEGIVIKNYEQFGPDKKIVIAKYVSEAFKESQKVSFKTDNPSKKDIVERLIEAYTTDARYRKAVQHLKESSKLTDSLKDIGALIEEVKQDIIKEEEDNIKNVLFTHFIKEIVRGASKGVPEWYKKLLLEQQFETSTDTTSREGTENNRESSAGLSPIST